ncbi:MAG: response regulator [Desulfobacula sp.]|nr:response regulator [Desulfobacula sp.]
MPGSGLSRDVLIMDDEMDMRFYLMSMVKTLGFIPHLAPNGLKGMAWLQKNRPDLIILDVMMPEKGGALVYQEIKNSSSFRTIPLIVFSGVEHSTFNHYIKMLNVNLNKKISEPQYYVEKSADPDYLMRVIKQAVR